MAADNALHKQSERHPDGWGVAYYVEGAPHVTKSAAGAMDDALFRRVSGIVSSETVVAHIRKATQGPMTVLNSHPFQYGRWVMAHNGDIPRFGEVRERLEAAIAPRLRRFILGDTDSERIFFLFLTELSKHGELGGRLGVDEVTQSLRETVALVRQIADAAVGSDRDAAVGSGDGPADGAGCATAAGRSLLTLLVTNGQVMAAHHGGKELYFSTWKRRCADRDLCPSLSAACEAPSTSGHVNHLLIASEPLQGENVWEPLSEGDIVGVDWRMRLVRERASVAAPA